MLLEQRRFKELVMSRIRQALKDAHVSAATLQAELNIKKTHAYRILEGKSIATDKQLTKIVALTGKDRSWFSNPLTEPSQVLYSTRDLHGDAPKDPAAMYLTSNRAKLVCETQKLAIDPGTPESTILTLLSNVREFSNILEEQKKKKTNTET